MLPTTNRAPLGRKKIVSWS